MVMLRRERGEWRAELLPGETERSRDPKYLAWIRTLPCMVCLDETTTEAHHEPPKGMGGGRSTDYDAVPLCGAHHRARHGTGSSDMPSAEDMKRAADKLRRLWMGRTK